MKSWRLQGEIALARQQRDEAAGLAATGAGPGPDIGNPTQLWKTHLALGRLYADTQRPEHARQAQNAAREVIDQVLVRLQEPGLRSSLTRLQQRLLL